MTTSMKLAAKLPDTPTVTALANALSDRPLKSRLLVIEVDAPRIQVDIDPLDGEEVRTPIAAIQSIAWIVEVGDQARVRLAARRAWDARTPQAQLPTVDSIERLHDAILTDDGPAVVSSFSDALHEAAASALSELSGVTLRTPDGRETVIPSNPEGVLS